MSSRDPFLYSARFRSDIEEIECYVVGGLHPVHLNDVVSASHNGRYRILHKLGFGSFSHVWLGQNLDQAHPGHRGVAVKFVAADQTRKTHEAEVNEYLASRSRGDPGFQNFALCLDTFQVSGPNGIHDVIISEPAILLLDLFYNDVMEHLDERLIFEQALSGVGFLHTHGVVHRDLHLGNMAIEFPFLRTAGVPELMNGSGRPRCHAFVPTQLPAEPPSIPTYLVENAKFCGRLTPLMKTQASFNVKIIDFGRSFRVGVHELPNSDEERPILKPPECNLPAMITRENKSFVATVQTRTSDTSSASEADIQPRDLSDLVWSTQGDIWILGCTFFTILLRDRGQWDHIFQSGYEGGAALFHAIAKYMGPMPDRYKLLLQELVGTDLEWPWDSDNCARALDIDPSLADPHVIENNWVQLEKEVLDFRRSWRTRGVAGPWAVDGQSPSYDDVSEEEDRKRVRLCLEVIRQMLGWSPEDRIKASDVAALPWPQLGT
ncbi:kinase-like domain-containing protein [Roridomyces roridus]|uniref:non-specific serine/threonine protein kinase n=1 Tax=Roridomyces roridus TaxID=1738132 RepID=A0AAD7BE60_9AGAR|nr:kinase-like domain-containing protein [Roridomyces roridus]